MFGFSSFSEAPFSSLQTTSIWQEIRNNANTWVNQAVSTGPIPSLSFNFVSGTYEVVDTLFEYDSIWKSASSGSNTWVVR